MKKLLGITALAVLLVAPVSLVLMAATVTSAAGLCGPAGEAREVKGVNLDAEQLANAQTVIGVVKEMRLPPRAAVIAMATAMQESSLRNDLRQRDHDSIGLFQQRIRFYGADVAGDPVKATKAFLAKLVNVPDWQRLPLTEAAAIVQIPREDLRGTYAKWEGLANKLLEQLWPGAPLASAGCEGGAGDPGAAAGGSVPPGYRLPTGTQAATAVRFALDQLGEPYLFGANGPHRWDCSSLMQRAWAAAGVAIPRVTYDQVNTGVAVPGLTAVQPGDLLFIPGANGSAAHPGHVGMYIGLGGDRKGYLVHAPQSGDVVKVTALSRWQRQIVAIRRPLESNKR